MPTMLRFCRWDFKERARWLGVHKGLKFQGIQVFLMFSRVPSDHARFGAPVLASHIVLQRYFHQVKYETISILTDSLQDEL